MNIIHKIILIFFITAASMVATFITPEIGSLKSLFSVTDPYLSYIMTTYLAGYLIGQIVFAIFAKRYGGVLSIRCGFLISVVGLFLQFLTLQFKLYEGFLFGRAITALGLSAGLICGFAIIKENIKQNEEKSYLSIITIAFTGSIYLSMFISGTLIKYCSLSSIFKYEIYYFIGLLLLTFFIPDIQKNRTQPVEIARRQYLNLKLINYSLVLSITTIIAYCYAFYGPLIVINSFGLSPQSYTEYNFINMAGLFLGSVIYKLASKKIKENQLIIFCLSFIIIISILLITLHLKKQLGFHNFMFMFFVINILTGIIYPSATYIALGCGSCKTSSSTTMNFIKIGMPSVALYFSTLIATNYIVNLSITIGVFSILFLLSLIITQTMSTKAVHRGQ